MCQSFCSSVLVILQLAQQWGMSHQSYHGEVVGGWLFYEGLVTVIENYLKMKNYEILAREFEVNFKKLHFFTKIAKKRPKFPPDPPKKQQK